MNYLALLLLFLSCCTKKEQKPREDFEGLMGQGLPAWQYVQTKEDIENLHFFKTVYESHKPLLLSPPSEELKIPKVIHFIWIGPKPFPRESVENVKSWIAKHPDWTVKFWTDRERPLPHPAMQKELIKKSLFSKLASCYHQSDNFGEKSDVLRYEILYKEGGVYVDHDVKCLKPFDVLHGAFDMYCGLEMPYKTALSSSVLPTNNVLASKPGHPVLKHCLDWLAERWDQIEQDYPGKDRDSVINRVSHRTFLVLGEVLKKQGNQKGNKDMIFPAFYFNAPKDEFAIFSRHLYAGSWFENESQFEKTTRERLMKISKKTNQTILFISLFFGFNFLCFAVLFYRLKKKGIL